jgi:acetolactate synthase-1/2/3 large subunit
MSDAVNVRTGARILVDQLRMQGVNHLFCVPGESFLDVLDALIDAPGLRLVVNRHESGSAFMAAGYARLTGQPGVAFVTRGPGACNAAVGVHHARQDSLPLILFVGLTPGAFQEREAFQEIDPVQFFGPIAKWAARVDRAERIPEFVGRAFQAATTGRPGPVVLGLPEDVIAQSAAAVDARCHQTIAPAPSDMQIAGLRRLLGQARRPIAIVGGPGWNAQSCDNLRVFAEANQLPVATAFRHQDVFDNTHPNYAGDVGLGINPALAERIRSADLVLALGVRLGEATTGGYRLIEAPVPRQRLVHAHPGIEELGRVYQADLMINAGMQQLAARLAMMSPVDTPAWSDALAQARADYLAWQAPPDGPAPQLDLRAVLLELAAALPRDALVCNGAGNYAAWVHRFFPFRLPGTQIAPTSGCMGFAVPAAIAAKIAAPERTVVCITGDGDFLMSSQELAAAAQCNAGVLFLVCNNGMYGTIRMHQERRFPGRVVGTDLTNPDFVQLARAYGGFASRVERSGDFAAALAAALAALRSSRLPALIELACDPAQLLPELRLPQSGAPSGREGPAQGG